MLTARVSVSLSRGLLEFLADVPEGVIYANWWFADAADVAAAAPAAPPAPAESVAGEGGGEAH